jgi:hypothetical protein
MDIMGTRTGRRSIFYTIDNTSIASSDMLKELDYLTPIQERFETAITEIDAAVRMLEYYASMWRLAPANRSPGYDIKKRRRFVAPYETN